MNRPNKRLDMDAIAQKLGVSKTTVHYAIRNTGRVSEGTRKKILRFAQEVGYRPNGLARSLRLKQTHTIGVILGSLTSTFHAHVLEGIDQITQEQGFTMLLSCSNGRPEKEQKLIETLLDRRVDGLIVAPADPDANRVFYQSLLAQQVKLIFVDREVPGVNVDIVASDNRHGALLITQHLIQSGRKRIGLVTTTSRDRRSTSVRERLAGAEQAIREADLPAPLTLGLDIADTTLDEEFGYNAIRHHLKNFGLKLDGIFAVHDGLAYGVIRALLEARISVPKAVAVAGFDDQDPSAYFQPPLTTVRQPMQHIGQEAARLLLRRLEEKAPLPSVRQRIALEPSLVLRASTDSK